MDQRTDSISYDDGFTPIAEKVSAVTFSNDDIEEDYEAVVKKERKQLPYLLTIQLVICFLIGITVFGIKSVSPSTFEYIKTIYVDAINDTMIAKTVFEEIDLSSISSYFNEVQG